VAGKKWGQLFLPRIGQEVIVEFLEGDPDRPIITGRVYNGVAMPPYELPANKTMSTLKSNSSKGGGGFNEVRFEDKKGEEQIFIHGEKNQDIRIKNDCFEWIGNNRHLIVKKDQLEHVENNRHEIVDADHMEEIGKDRHLKVKGKQAMEIVGSKSLKVAGDVIEEFKANHSEKASMSYYLKAMGIVIEADTGITLKVGGNSVVIDNTGVTVKGSLVTIEGSMVKIDSGPGSPAASGSPGSLISPAAPTKAEEADKADPGEVEQVKARQRQLKAGKYGSTQVQAFKPPKTDEEKAARPSWIEIKLKDDDGNPVPGQKYKVSLPDGKTVAEGTLDGNGFARVDGVEPGTCKITFPDLDKDAWGRG
jgi:type VI secretion system secreted protein VgrG